MRNIESDIRRRMVGSFFREVRIKAGFTQWDVARRLRYSNAQFVSNWERGVSLPPLDTLPKLAEVLSVPGRKIIAVMHRYQEQMLILEKKRVTDVMKRSR